jgi:hypothetical protein
MGDEPGPLVRQALELPVAVELVPKEVPEHEQARAEMRRCPRQPGLVELEETLVAALFEQGGGDAPVHVRARSVVDGHAAVRPEDARDHPGGRRLAVGRADHDRTAVEPGSEAVNGVRRHPNQHPAGERGPPAATAATTQSPHGTREAALRVE